MDVLFSIEALGVLVSLIFLQAVLGFDNLLYISIESQRAPADRQSFVRKAGIAIAVILRLILLFVIMRLLAGFIEPLFAITDSMGSGEAIEVAHGTTNDQYATGAAENVVTDETPVFSFPYISGAFNLKAIIFLFGGAFIMYTAVKEINHLLAMDDLAHGTKSGQKSTFAVLAIIVFMNLIFSFDSILSMLPLTNDPKYVNDDFISPQFVLLAIAVITSGLLMILLADKVADFIKKNRMFEVLGLFILLIVGIMLLAEGGHIAHLTLFGYPIEAMSKSTFYFSVAVLFIVDIIQTRYQRKLMARKHAEVVDPSNNEPVATAHGSGTPHA
jgi:predicted tellurium resistance membrane protein TerC